VLSSLTVANVSVLKKVLEYTSVKVLVDVSVIYQISFYYVEK